MASEKKVALITGGASGLGLAVASSLAARGDWELHLVDLNATAGAAAVDSVPFTFFHQADITDYRSLAQSFKDTFARTRRLDFVFANAGVAEQSSFYKRHETADGGLEPPPAPDLLMSRIMFDGAINTCYLALHYFRLSPKDIDKSIVVTSSCGGLYPATYTPIYTSIKAGNIGLMRAIASPYYHWEGVRVNAICPGVVKTNLLNESQWSQFDSNFLTPIETVQRAVLVLIDNKDPEPQEKTRIDGVNKEKKGVLWGETVELIGPDYYFREPPQISGVPMESVMRATDIVAMGADNVAIFNGRES